MNKRVIIAAKAKPRPTGPADARVGKRADQKLKRLSALYSLIGVIGTLLLVIGPVGAEAGEIIVSVPGIPGPYCAYGAEKRLLEMDGVQQVILLWQEEQIRVLIEDGSSVTPADVKKAFQKADYPYKYIVSKE